MYNKLTGCMTAPPFRLAALAFFCLLWLPAAPAQAACSMEQTASNEIIIRVGSGVCNGAALRASISGALAGASPASPAASHTRPDAYAGVQRSAGQGALWRLANVTNQANSTSFTLPGMR